MCVKTPKANTDNLHNIINKENIKTHLDDTIVNCEKCGAECDISDVTYCDGTALCEECVENYTFICDFCRETCWLDDGYQSEEMNVCDDCLDEETFVCSHCNGRFANDSNAGDDNTPLCNSCYEYHYTHCERCNCVISNDDSYFTEDDEDRENPYCYGCYEHYANTSYIHSYSYKPQPIFHGDSSLYFGVELEIDSGGKKERNAKILCDIANCDNDNIYIKTDGSLEDGLEIVTHPMSLTYHINDMPWESLLECGLDLGYISHKADTCGLHVHVNRNYFSTNQYRQDECIGRVLYVVERFWEELLRFSRRTENQLERWSRRYGYKENPAEILHTAKNGSSNRYTCVNLTNYNTVEFRIFRGTLKHNTLIATLQLVNEICNVAFSMSDEQVSRLGWCDFMERLSPDLYPELITYLKERRLYINEPVSITIGEE